MSKLRVTVDHNRCVGSQLCVLFLPDAFEINGDGQSDVKSGSTADEKQIISTAEQCPQCAIRVVDNESGEVLFPPPGLTF